MESANLEQGCIFFQDPLKSHLTFFFFLGNILDTTVFQKRIKLDLRSQADLSSYFYFYSVLDTSRGYNLCYRIHNWAEFRVITSSKRICIEIWIPREQKNISKSSLRIWLMTNAKIWVIWAVWSQWQCREDDGSDFHLFNINNIPAQNKEYLAVKATDLNNLTFCGFVHHQ